MNVLVIDGQGGQLGAQIIKAIASKIPEITIQAVGTNVIATTAMMRAGVRQAATGENPVLVASRKADIIVGPIGIVVADSLMGEVTPKMALAVGQADATRILIPMNRCENQIAGISDLSMSRLIEDAVEKIKAVMLQQ